MIRRSVIIRNKCSEKGPTFLLHFRNDLSFIDHPAETGYSLSSYLQSLVHAVGSLMKERNSIPKFPLKMCTFNQKLFDAIPCENSEIFWKITAKNQDNIRHQFKISNWPTFSLEPEHIFEIILCWLWKNLHDQLLTFIWLNYHSWWSLIIYFHFNYPGNIQAHIGGT